MLLDIWTRNKEILSNSYLEKVWLISYNSLKCWVWKWGHTSMLTWEIYVSALRALLTLSVPAYPSLGSSTPWSLPWIPFQPRHVAALLVTSPISVFLFRFPALVLFLAWFPAIAPWPANKTDCCAPSFAPLTESIGDGVAHPHSNHPQLPAHQPLGSSLTLATTQKFRNSWSGF